MPSGFDRGSLSVTMENFSPVYASTGTSSRRLDIQGLRAIAVLFVVVYHAGLPLPGGFVGVDIFFVISGFVITLMLHREWLTTGRVDLGRFYWRRFKRLTPALALVVVVTVLLSALLLSPLGPQQNAALTGLGAMGLVANFVIASTTNGYFDVAAETNPLLNSWSLSVEEQFYVFFPAVLIFGWYLARRQSWLRLSPLVIVSVVGILSFGTISFGPLQSIVARVSDQIFDDFQLLLGFFSPITRIWEFAAGALLALVLMRRSLRSIRLGSALGITGLVMLVASAFMIDAARPFPSTWTLLPVGGTVLLLIAGTDEASPVSRLLAVPPLAKIGDWSYSIYLWHWPFIVFAVRLWPANDLAPIAATLVAMLPAIASYYWLERPLRAIEIQQGKAKAAFVGAVIVSPVLVCLGVLLMAERLWVTRYEAGLAPTFVDGSVLRDRNLDDLTGASFSCSNPTLRDMSVTWSETSSCLQSRPESAVDIALIGDSHASQLFYGFATTIPASNVATYALASTLPTYTDARMGLIIDEVADDPAITTVVVNAFWSDYENFMSAAELLVTIQRLTDAGKNVYILNDVPTFAFPATDCIYGLSPLLQINRCTQDVSGIRKTISAYELTLQEVVDQVPGAKLLDSARYLCGNQECDMTREGKLLYRDNNHLTRQGSQFVVDRLLDNYPDFARDLRLEK